ncbi:hypothetical protein [Streptomyces sp. NPDC002386]
MSPAWVAGTVRARELALRRVGAAGARELAVRADLGDALRELVVTPYGKYAPPVAGLSEAQRAVSATLLWHLRVLAGWLPRGGARLLVPLACGFEVANVAALFAGNGHGPAPVEPYRLGALETAWRRLEGAGSGAGLRAVLTASAWGDPGGDSAGAVLTGMRMAAARRTALAVPQARDWAVGRAALLTARELFVHGRPLTEPVRRDAARLLGARATGAASYPRFRELLPAPARRLLAEAGEPGALWRAEVGWWRTLRDDGAAMLRDNRFGPRAVVGAVAVLSVDAWRVRAALESAARGGRVGEAFDALA